jgi:hypothetical protein
VESTAVVVSANLLHRYSVALIAADPSSGARSAAHVDIFGRLASFALKRGATVQWQVQIKVWREMELHRVEGADL